MPILRVKNGNPFMAVRGGVIALPPNSNIVLSWRKKSLVSGKNSENRPVLTCRSSSGESEKSVLSVRVPVREGVIL